MNNEIIKRILSSIILLILTFYCIVKGSYFFIFLLVAIFFSTHNPTTLNRQGADVGTQYRSALFYTSENQRKIIDQVITELTQQSIFDAPIVTEINAEMPFYTAEKEHNNYFNNNREQPYCQAVIEPKINKFIETYKAHLK